MKYIYMHNYRGFSDTLVPMEQTNFLVGENSTGKSSFLKILQFISNPACWMYPELLLIESQDDGCFSDLVSAWAKDNSYFQFGLLIIDGNENDGFGAEFRVHTFSKRDGTPSLTRHIRFKDGNLITLAFDRNRIKSRSSEPGNRFTSSSDAIRFFLKTVSIERTHSTGFRYFPKEVSPTLPLSYLISAVQNLESGKDATRIDVKEIMPNRMDLTWIAPIRTKPRRFYDGLIRSYSPEGEHVPYVLKRSLKVSSKSAGFADKLAAFGESSGLFETIIPHSFGKNPQAPFELLIKLSGTKLNINNVGYGVSQVLPLVVEFLHGQNGTFAVQQPEVHLHPKAQAALGGLIYEIAKEKSHSFYIETHSDYLIDRYRLSMRNDSKVPSAQVIFFQRINDGNRLCIIPILADGSYPKDQPKEFREFFIKEEMKLLDI